MVQVYRAKRAILTIYSFPSLLRMTMMGNALERSLAKRGTEKE